MTVTAELARPDHPDQPDRPPVRRDRHPGGTGVGGPAVRAWRETILTRAKEIESQCDWVACQEQRPAGADDLIRAIGEHVHAARQATAHGRRTRFGSAARVERATSNLDAAEAHLLQIAPAEYVYGLLPSLLNQVRWHLGPDDPRRQEMERIAQMAVGTDLGHPAKVQLTDTERGRIVSAFRGTKAAGRREQLQVRSFRNVVVVATIVMSLLTFGLILMGLLQPTLMPLCFQPERAGEAVVVCPTAQSALVSTAGVSGPAAPDVDDTVRNTAARQDILLIALVGLTAAAVAAAAAIRGVRGSCEPYSLPVALAVLKLPTGALTAVLGLLLMRGQFVPGLSALDTSAQILAWALVFGYAQQAFTHLVDRQAHAVLDNVRGADRPKARKPGVRS